ncbi:TPA: phage head morphogenesis protein, partial [Morganella morganii]|nr:phage head morphogenesis protein [Morganella morganii]
MSQLIKGMIADYEKTFSSLHEDFDGATMDAS